jgi:flagellar biosynthesis protein FlhB
LQQARKDGDHPLSPVLVSSAALAAGVLTLPFAADAVAAETRELLALLQADSTALAQSLAGRVLQLCTPVVGASAAGALVAGLLQTGGRVSLRPLAWKSDRLNPFTSAPGGWVQRLSDACLSMVSLGVVLALAVVVLGSNGPAIASSIGDAKAGLVLAGQLAQQLLAHSVVLLVARALVGGVVARLRWLKRLRMTPDAIKRERRESEADPNLKLARHRAHHELMHSADLRRLAQCTLVVTGPRLTTGLRYAPGQDTAPRVLIQTVGLRSQQLVARALSEGLFVHSDPALARTLASLPVDEEVPQMLYTTLAELIQNAAEARTRPSH